MRLSQNMPKLTKSVRRSSPGIDFSLGNSYLKQDYETVNEEALKGVLGYLKHLYMEGEISDKAYRVLVSYALSTFVENTVSHQLDLLFDDIDVTFREASKSLLADLLA
jgi:hypothetical protein